MTKLKYKKWYGAQRKECRKLAEWHLKEDPDCLTINVPTLLPMEAQDINRVGVIRDGDDFIECIYDESGRVIHTKWSDMWRYFTIAISEIND